MDDFIVRALLAGFAVALMSGGLGVFILWRRMVYFGDTISHASLLGVSMGLLLGVSVNLGILAVSLIIAVLMIILQQKRSLGNDTMLGILAHSSLSLGLVAMTFIEGVRVDLNAWLFGDILAVTTQELWMLLVITLVVCSTLFFIWKPLLSLTVHEDLAKVEGVNITRISALYTLLIALTVAVTMKVIGAILISSLLIIPAAAARQLAKTPEAMAIIAMVIGVLAVMGGITASWFLDTPAGPSIVVAATVVFLLVQIIPAISSLQKS